jgi:PAS domain-containing protein
MQAKAKASLTAKPSHLVLETAPDAFIGIDLEGRSVTWKVKAAQTFGWNAGEAATSNPATTKSS